MRYKTIMLGRSGYAKLSSAKREMRKKSGMKLSFEDTILNLICRRLEFAEIDDRLKQFIEKAALKISEIRGVEGVLLFGSVAKGTYNKYSDIDVAVITRAKKLDTLDGVVAVKNAMGGDEVSLMKLGLPHSLSPIVLDMEDIKAFKPFYFDLADYGIILYERTNALSDFVDCMKWRKHGRETVKGVEVITW